jgi:antitoxin VapB
MAQVESLLDEQGLEALVLKKVSSVAWATCGAPTYVNTAAAEGIATLVIKRGEQHLVTNRIEAPRLEKEEGLAAQGWRFHVSDWFGGEDLLSPLAGNRFGADSPVPGAVDLGAEVSRLRSVLQDEEQVRFRLLGRRCAEAMNAAIARVQPGMSEHEIAAALAFEAHARGAQPIVNLIATDERIFNFRHPLPTDKVMERYAMLVLCGRRNGLVCSVTRLVHFGPLPADVRAKADAVAQIDATFIENTRPGATLGSIFATAQEAYAATGFADEWRLHHQGGPAGYEPREVVAWPDSTYTVAQGQAYAWNPSITGAKSEDSILVGPHGNEVLTTIDGWPTRTVVVGGKTVQRPDILVVE